MMTFIVTTIDDRKQSRCFSYGLSDLEANLALIDAILAMGHSLISVQLVDRNKIVDLPVEMFNDVSTSTALNQLECQWKAILAK